VASKILPKTNFPWFSHVQEYRSDQLTPSNPVKNQSNLVKTGQTRCRSNPIPFFFENMTVVLRGNTGQRRKEAIIHTLQHKHSTAFNQKNK